MEVGDVPDNWRRADVTHLQEGQSYEENPVCNYFLNTQKPAKNNKSNMGLTRGNHV